MPIKSNAKGSQFERDVCRRLSLWVSDGYHDDLFWRSASSGGRATQRSKTGRRTSNQYGDITATNADGASLLKQFTFELKKGYSKVNLQDLLDRPKTAKHEIRAWVEQAKLSSKQAGTQDYMIIWQRDRCQALCLVNEGAFNILKQHGLIDSLLEFRTKELTLYAFLFSDLLALDYESAFATAFGIKIEAGA